MVDFMNYLLRQKDPISGLVKPGGLGDWVPPGGNSYNTVPPNATSTFYWLLDLYYMSEMGNALGYMDEAKSYLEQYTDGCKAYHKFYFNEEFKTYDWGGQTSLMIPLYLNIVPSKYKSMIQKQLIDDIKHGIGGIDKLMPSNVKRLKPLGPNHLKVSICIYIYI